MFAVAAILGQAARVAAISATGENATIQYVAASKLPRFKPLVIFSYPP